MYGYNYVNIPDSYQFKEDKMNLPVRRVIIDDSIPEFIRTYLVKELKSNFSKLPKLDPDKIPERSLKKIRLQEIKQVVKTSFKTTSMKVKYIHFLRYTPLVLDSKPQKAFDFEAYLWITHSNMDKDKSLEIKLLKH